MANCSVLMLRDCFFNEYSWRPSYILKMSNYLCMIKGAGVSKYIMKTITFLCSELLLVSWTPKYERFHY